ncbi:MAG TPA: hypothetical protein HPP66_04250 [Planctomycetes bacterium]|nr:hypothetical protein [Planctomycetota bacterium]
MTRRRNKKKKPGAVRRILKWIGLTLLVALIILVLVFRAPWKVTTLLVTILLACTVLPKRYRKWFWLSAAAIVIALIIWVFLPEDSQGWRPYTFDEELAALEAKYEIPDSENAATIYNDLLEKYDANTFEPNFMDDDLDSLTRREPWSGKDHPELAKWLQGHEETLAALIRAGEKEKCHFVICANHAELGRIMKRLSPIRRWAFLLIRAANNDLAEERIEQALEKQMAVLQMAKHQLQQSTVIEMLVGKAIEALALGQFKRFIVTGGAAEKHVSVIEKAVTDIKHDWTYDWPRILDCEKLLMKNMLCGFFYEVNTEGKTRLNRGATGYMRTERQAKTVQRPGYWRRKSNKAKTIFWWFYLPPTHKKGGQIIDTSYEMLYKMTKPDFDWAKGTGKSSTMIRLNYQYLIEHLVGILEPSYHRIHDIYLRTVAEQRGTRLIITLRRYKNENSRWPESLEDIKSLAPEEILVDPINGGSFVYKLTEENFTLYSKGKNNIDEGGKRDPESGADDWLIWPRKARKTKNGKADTAQSNTKKDVVK